MILSELDVNLSRSRSKPLRSLATEIPCTVNVIIVNSFENVPHIFTFYIVYMPTFEYIENWICMSSLLGNYSV